MLGLDLGWGTGEIMGVLACLLSVVLIISCFRFVSFRPSLSAGLSFFPLLLLL